MAEALTESLAASPPPDRHVVVRRPVLGALLVIVERLSALVALILVLPLLVVVALVIRLDSPGPVLFRQVRVGQYGRRFAILKLRTMRAGADAELAALLHERHGATAHGAYVKLDADPRITRVGGLLRRTSIDELPQLWNVVRGDMALVGPRPQTPAEAASYGVSEWRRLLVRPGITGLWQVSGRSSLTPDEALELDIHYVRTWTPMLDARLLLRTVGAVLAGRGAR